MAGEAFKECTLNPCWFIAVSTHLIFFPWHRKGLVIAVTAWEVGFVISMLLWRVSEQSGFEPELALAYLNMTINMTISKYPVNDSRIWSILRGQMSKIKPSCPVHLGVFAIMPKPLAMQAQGKALPQTSLHQVWI